jgi:uncharacterized protein YkwD
MGRAFADGWRLAAALALFVSGCTEGRLIRVEPCGPGECAMDASQGPLVDAGAGRDAGLSGDGSAAGEDASSGPLDSGWPPADSGSAPADSGLPAGCGDGVCGGDETCADCPADCGPCACGDGTCDGNGGETCTGCPVDCETSEVVCGNGACQEGESSVSCRPDCGPEPWPSAWLDWEQEVVVLMNEHRAAGTACPSGPKSPVGPLTMNTPLQRAAQLHSWDMSYSGYFSHTSCNGRSFTARASAQGINARAENIGRGQSSPAAIVAGWMSSTTGHCDAVMNGSYVEVGIGYAQAEGGSRLWTAKFR